MGKLTKFNSNNLILIILPITLVFGNRVVLLKNSLNIPLIAVIILLTTFLGRIKGQIQIESKRLFLYLLTVSLAILVNIVSSQYSKDFSIFSIAYLSILYFPVIFVLKKPENGNLIFTFYQKSIFIISIIGILQFLTQLAGIPYRDWLLFYFPKYIDEFNTSIPLFRGSHLFRSNGLFLVEPSFYSQYLAIAILIDLFYFKYYRRLPIFILAILFSFSGTGIVVLVFGLIVKIPKLSLRKLFLPGSLLFVILLVFFTTEYGGVLINRLGEFTNENASAYNRFIAPFESFEYWYDEGLKVFLFGGGAGSVDSFRENIKEDIPVMHPNFFIKSFYEYGLISGFVLFFLITYLFWGRKSTSGLNLPLFIMFTIVSSGLLNAQQLYFCYTLGMLSVLPKKMTVATKSAVSIA
ncbi:MAG: hypothetical protein H6654_11835 [Ardenticatenaceae bacterium]|nr:hypothetical protein [Ardenticatenaceae bacterium]MCB8974240.1 hypothetical protein [Ardenticatenaceae bacterium]